jgi:hypothetical protein
MEEGTPAPIFFEVIDVVPAGIMYIFNPVLFAAKKLPYVSKHDILMTIFKIATFTPTEELTEGEAVLKVFMIEIGNKYEWAACP